MILVPAFVPGNERRIFFVDCPATVCPSSRVLLKKLPVPTATTVLRRTLVPSGCDIDYCWKAIPRTPAVAPHNRPYIDQGSSNRLALCHLKILKI